MDQTSLIEQEWKKKLASIRPSNRQLKWQETEFYGFIHFNINTFTGKQWGDGSESPLLFNPTELDVEQWVVTMKEAGMNGLILTCKHHDGFCLWPSEFTDHTVASSPWKNGEGDLVKDVSDACRKHGMKFGIYLSPWDRHEETYGNSPTYNQFFVNQLKELLTNYGEVFSVWFDGACGEGPNGQKQVYDWDRYYETIRELQPDAAISVCGPDVRWCGNEAGATREQEWSIVPKSLQDAEKIQEASQQTENHQEFIREVSSAEEDLGSRNVLEETDTLVWYPAEVNTSIRPSWFYDEREDNQVKSTEELFDLYVRTVGGNSTFLLNIPPDRRGVFHKKDVSVLKDFGQKLKSAFQTDLTESATQTLTTPYSIAIAFDKPTLLNCVVLQEDITKGQRVERFTIEAEIDGQWETVYTDYVIGYKKIALLDATTVQHIRIIINASRLVPYMKAIQTYYIE